MNVLTIALFEHGYDLQWKNPEKKVKEVFEEKNIEGFFLNREREKKFYHKILNNSSRHWTCIRKLKDYYYFFDSKLEDVLPYNEKEVMEFLELVM